VHVGKTVKSHRLIADRINTFLCLFLFYISITFYKLELLARNKNVDDRIIKVFLHIMSMV